MWKYCSRRGTDFMAFLIIDETNGSFTTKRIKVSLVVTTYRNARNTWYGGWCCIAFVERLTGNLSLLPVELQSIQNLPKINHNRKKQKRTVWTNVVHFLYRGIYYVYVSHQEALCPLLASSSLGLFLFLKTTASIFANISNSVDRPIRFTNPIIL